MKEFALKHPWLTFFLVDAAVVNICKTICILTGHDGNNTVAMFRVKKEDEEKEESEEE